MCSHIPYELLCYLAPSKANQTYNQEHMYALITQSQLSVNWETQLIPNDIRKNNCTEHCCSYMQQLDKHLS